MRFLILIPIFLFSFDFKQQFINKNYKKICLYGIHNFKKIKNNEDTLSLVGFSCVKSDYFIYLPAIINNLKHSTKARQNSIYFSTLFLEKRLLISFVLDNTDISYYRFPFINHPISIVVTNLISKNYKKQNDTFVINYKNKTYKIYHDNEDRVFIDIYQNNQLIQSHWYR